jgi:hypothetical protein
VQTPEQIVARERASADASETLQQVAAIVEAGLAANIDHVFADHNPRASQRG